MMRALVLILILFVALVLFFSGFRNIPDGYMGVEVAALGKPRIMPDALPQGWHWRRPIMIQIHPYQISEQSLYLSMPDVRTADKKSISFELNIYYTLSGEKLVNIHTKFRRPNTIYEKIKHFSEACVLEIGKEFSQQEIVEHAKEKVSQTILKSLKAEFEEIGIQITNVLLTRISLPADEAENAQKKMEQMDLNAKIRQKEMEIIHAERIKEQELRVKEAESQQKADILRAEGLKQAEILKAEGKAEALLKIQKVIGENPNLLRFLYIDKISDKVQVIVAPAHGSDLLIDEAMKTVQKRDEATKTVQKEGE